MYSVLHKSKLGAAISNWRLVLLGTTGLVLSLASGWTTWDGMRNFTREPLLSLMITFGIQGVMLIVAWLIGESFATGMGRKKSLAADRYRLTLYATAGLAIALFSALTLWLLSQYDLTPASWTFPAGNYLLLLIAIVVLATLVLFAGRDIVDNYMQTIRVILRNAMLWLMFLACMATSVFFSFDSLFTTIFPASERARAAELRARSQAARINSDIVALNARRRLEQRTSFLAGKEWQAYAQDLDGIAKELQAAPAKIDGYLQKERSKDLSLSAKSQAELALIEAKEIRAKTHKKQLTEQARKLQNQAKQLAATISGLRQQIFAKEQEIIAKSTEMEAEEAGIGGTLKAGRGPVYRQLTVQRMRLRAAKRNLQLQQDVFKKQLKKIQVEIETKQRRAAQAEAEVLQWQGKARVAAGTTPIEKSVLSLVSLRRNIGAAMRQLSGDRIFFEQQPSRQRLNKLQATCAAAIELMRRAPISLTGRTTRNCDPGKLHEAAAQLYALDRGAIAARKLCATAPAKTLQSATARSIEAELSSTRRCLQGAGLSRQDAITIGAQIDSLERNRDDKAHRFVVTTNAFADGNRLAYLALAIAVAIDALVFISGLFGANVLRSPLSAIPLQQGRTARHLDSVIENALLPDIYDNATLALESIRPVAPSQTQPDLEWSHEIHLSDTVETSVATITKILNSASVIGAAKADPRDPQHFLLRGELIEFLNNAAMRAYGQGEDSFSRASLRKVIATALRPDIHQNISTVLRYLKPFTEEPGFSSQISMSDVLPEDMAVVRRCLNAAATRDAIKCVDQKSDAEHFLIAKNLYRVLIAMSDGIRGSGGREQASPAVVKIVKPVRRRPPRKDPQDKSRTASDTKSRQKANPKTEQPSAAAKPVEPAPTATSTKVKALIRDDTIKFD